MPLPTAVDPRASRACSASRIASVPDASRPARDVYREKMNDAIALLPQDQRDELFRAQEQVEQFMEQFDSPAQMLEAIGLDEDDEDDEDDDHDDDE